MFKSNAKSKIVYFIMALALILMPFLFCATSSVSAAGNIISETDMDANLYYKLRGIAGGTLRDDSIYSKNITTLDLSFTAVGAVSTSKKISSLEGLQLLDLRSVTVLKVNNQNLSEISKNTLSGLPNLERLEILNNKLTTLDLQLNKNWNVLLADNNLLTSVDVSALNTQGFEEENSVISLNNNNFKSFSDITFPQITNTSKLTVNLINNNITDVENISGLDYELNLGIQGLKYNILNDKNTITTAQDIKFYNTTLNISAEIYKVNNNTEELLFSLQNTPEGTTTKRLSVGNYKVKYLANGTPLTEENSEGFEYLKNEQFTVIPQKPTFYFIIDGKRVDSFEKLTQKATLVIEGDPNSELYSSIDNADWVKGNEVKLTKGGNFNISLKSKIGDFESETVSFYIQAALNLKLSTGMLILLIGLVAIVFVIAIVIIKKYALDR